VATPDHLHAPASTLAMSMGKHCFCQKPLTHSVAEARRMRELAKKKKVATQMGNQGSAGPGLRRAVEVIQAGVIGKPLELHVWSNRPVWPQGIVRPNGEDQVPEHIDWDLWLGPAPVRPYKDKTYHSFAWRGWKDFGTGALGDMACHTVNMPFRALRLGYPTAIECEATSDYLPETYPKSSRIRFEFPKREGLPPLKFWWYDGNPSDKAVKPYRPNEELTREIVALNGSLPISGALIIGDQGKIFSPDDYGSTFFILAGNEGKFSKGSDHEACKAVPQTIPRSKGHYQEWVDAIRGGAPAYSNFDIAAYLTEIILLGCVALNVGVGEKLDWDGPKMRAKNNKKADQFVRREYRKGWKLS
jgi:predicted dehydrogenase